MVITLQAFGWYIVSLYIATYVTALGFNSTLSTGILSAFNASAIIGYLVTGPAIDKLSSTVTMAISSGLCGIITFTLFGFATSLPLVLVFALLFGAAVSLRASSSLLCYTYTDMLSLSLTGRRLRLLHHSHCPRCRCKHQLRQLSSVPRMDVHPWHCRRHRPSHRLCAVQAFYCHSTPAQGRLRHQWLP